jgi:hypothetical protein
VGEESGPGLSCPLCNPWIVFSYINPLPIPLSLFSTPSGSGSDLAEREKRASTGQELGPPCSTSHAGIQPMC